MKLPPALAQVARRVDFERLLEWRPSYPPLAVEIDRGEAVLVRLRRRRGGAALEAHGFREIPDDVVGPSIFRPNLASPDVTAARLKDLFEKTGTKPGKVSLVLPDNLAKIAIVTLPEKPQGRKQLEEVLRFKLRRSVPFRLDEAAVSFQVLHETPGEVSVLAAVMLRSVVEQYEGAVVKAGGTPGLVDLCTPALVNLCRKDLDEATRGGSDAALVNAAKGYFSLVIVRGGRIVFFRCKSYVTVDHGVEPGEDEAPVTNGNPLARELATSISYYQDKLAGLDLGTAFVRTVSTPHDEIAEILQRQGIGRIERVDPSEALGLGSGLKLDPEAAQRVAPCVGAAAGRAA